MYLIWLTYAKIGLIRFWLVPFPYNPYYLLSNENMFDAEVFCFGKINSDYFFILVQYVC